MLLFLNRLCAKRGLEPVCKSLHYRGHISLAVLSRIGYNNAVIEIRKTDVFEHWFRELCDHRAMARINA